MTKTAFDFKAWLNVQPPKKKYDYLNASGDCAIGQYMKSRGELWNMKRYSELTNEIFGGGLLPILIKSKTFGQLKKELA